MSTNKNSVNTTEKTAITPTREQDYPEWYQEVIKAAELAENSVTRGCMVIKPWGYGIWERTQHHLDTMIKETGHENAYFPLLIPLSFLEKEATHVDGFAKECAVVTHHRLEARNGKLFPAAPLEEPYVIRPTSETIIGDAFAKWIQSYRDLPLLINQWANVLRWEMRPRLFLRSAEFLWQEGHTVHESEEDARRETLLMLECYRKLAEDFLAMPVITGEKPAYDRFPGAVDTYCIEAMMQDGKALQAGTSHYLGQNFSKAFDIKFLNRKGVLEHGYTTSWGASTRLIGGLIMTHSDDNGLRVPPKVAPKHVVIIPIIPKDDQKEKVLSYCEKLKSQLSTLRYDDEKIVVHLDSRDIRGGEKSWGWIKKGVPVRIEVGPRDIDSNSVTLFRRDQEPKEKTTMAIEEIGSTLTKILAEIQSNYFEAAKKFRSARIHREIKTIAELREFFNQSEKYDCGGFVAAKWSEEPDSEKVLDEFKAVINCIPTEQSNTEGTCILTGKKATKDILIARKY